MARMTRGLKRRWSRRREREVGRAGVWGKGKGEQQAETKPMGLGEIGDTSNAYLYFIGNFYSTWNAFLDAGLNLDR